LVADGARAVATPAEAAASAEVMITMLVGPAALDAVMSGPEGVAAGIRPEACLVEMSTVGPAAALAARDLLPAGTGFVDAPVMGHGRCRSPAARRGPGLAPRRGGRRGRGQAPAQRGGAHHPAWLVTWPDPFCGGTWRASPA
jgi:NAD binding domain of 6-phosphogluconate dehydrogenase